MFGIGTGGPTCGSTPRPSSRSPTVSLPFTWPSSACTSAVIPTPSTPGWTSTNSTASVLWSTSLGDTEAFPPEEAGRIVETVHQAPEVFGIGRSRWRLADLRSVVPALGSYTEGGISLALRRLGVSRQRGRLAVHSPDVAYEAKLALVRGALSLALEGEATVLYGAEVAFYRHPTLAPKYARRGDEPIARLSRRSNLRHRVAGALDVRTGRVSYLGHSKIGVVDLRRFLRLLRRVYKQGRL